MKLTNHLQIIILKGTLEVPVRCIKKNQSKTFCYCLYKEMEYIKNKSKCNKNQMQKAQKKADLNQQKD